jgi:hypothetical protein
MAKVVDAARVTTPSNTVWRTCTGCAQLTALPVGTLRCPSCITTPADAPAVPRGWQLANQYAELVGRIEAWAFPVVDTSDAACLARIRDLITDFNQQRQEVG